MTTDQFQVRERALEEEFFAKHNAALKESFQRKVRREQASEALATASGVRDPIVLEHMLAVGLSPETGAAFALLPLILTAWADGKLDDDERAAVLSAAREDGGIEAHGPAHDLLDHWLARRPPDKLWNVWREYVAALTQTLDDDARRAFKDTVIGRAERVARASGGLLGVGEHISHEERALLDELTRAFDNPA